MDFKYHKVFHFFLIFCFLAGMCFGIYQPEFPQVLSFAVSIMLPLFLLYPLFKIGAIGAGDIKLFMAIGGFFKPYEMLLCITVSFCFGGAISLVLLLYRRCLIRRLTYFLTYLHDVYRSGFWKLYESPQKGGEHGEDKPLPDSREGKIHFTLPILLSVLAWTGGFY